METEKYIKDKNATSTAKNNDVPACNEWARCDSNPYFYAGNPIFGTFEDVIKLVERTKKLNPKVFVNTTQEAEL